ncbi:MAG: acyl-CoA thioesterase [Terriglobales bacterium]
MKPRRCETQLRVRYAETDQMGVVYHSNFIIWFEVGRVEALRQLGFAYKQMERDGCHLPVVEVRCRYKAPARYDDVITVRTTIRNVRSGMVHFHYEVLRQEDASLLAEGETVHFVIGDDGNKRALPEKYLAALKSAVAK